MYVVSNFIRPGDRTEKRKKDQIFSSTKMYNEHQFSGILKHTVQIRFHDFWRYINLYVCM